MFRRFVACCAALAFVLAAVGQAKATTITFDNYTTGGNIITNQYAAQGVTFTGAETLSTSDDSLNTIYPPYSGTTVVYDYSSGTITATATSGTWSSVSGYITGNTSITLFAYDASNNLLGSVSTGGANYIGAGTPNILLSLNETGIAYVEFHDDGDSFTLDNFSFTASTSAAPEPASLTMLGIGAFGLMGYAWRRRKLALKAA